MGKKMKKKSRREMRREKSLPPACSVTSSGFAIRVPSMDGARKKTKATLKMKVALGV